MMKTQYIGFHSPKTSGSTTIAVNISLLRKQVSAEERIAFLQIAGYGDIDLHIGAKPLFDLEYLQPFIQTPEWDVSLLSKIAVPLLGVDFYSSPNLSNWKNLSSKNLGKIMDLLSQKYDKIFIDFGGGTPEKIMEFCLSKLCKIILVGNLSPASFNAIDLFQKNNKLSEIETCFFLNQCPSESLKNIKKQLDKLDMEFLGVVPQDIKGCWYQTYEGLPCALQKRSALKKALLEIVPKL